MKRLLTKLNDLQKMLLLSLIIGIALSLLSIIAVVLGQPGWLIGIVIGTIVELLNIVLLYKGSEYVLSESKNAMFLLFFMLRMVVIIIAFAITAYLDFKANINIFKNSIWGVVTGYGPMQIVVVITQLKKPKEGDEK